MTTTFENARVEDRVWAFKLGWGTIKKIQHDLIYPIRVEFDSGATATFTFSGKFHDAELFASLFWNEVRFDIPTMPKRMVKKKFTAWKLVTDEGQFSIVTYKTEQEASENIQTNGYLMPLKHVVKIEYEIEVEE